VTVRRGRDAVGGTAHGGRTLCPRRPVCGSCATGIRARKGRGTAAGAVAAHPRTGLSAGSLREPPRRISCALPARHGSGAQSIAAPLSEGTGPGDAPWGGRTAPARSAPSPPSLGRPQGFRFAARTAVHGERRTPRSDNEGPQNSGKETGAPPASAAARHTGCDGGELLRRALSCVTAEVRAPTLASRAKSPLRQRPGKQMPAMSSERSAAAWNLL
jgi:hypothetical protein